MDRNQSIIDFLMTCPTIIDGKLFFNFSEEQENYHQVLVEASDIALHKPYIDGTVLKSYTFNIVSYKSINYNPLVVLPGYEDENVADMAEVQDIIDWINEQEDVQNYPDFGEGYYIDKIETLTDNPDLFGVDTSVNPPIAKYGISIRVEYLDTTKKIFN